MKKTIIVSLIILGVVLLVAMLFVGISNSNADVEDTTTYNINTEPLIITTLNDTIIFSSAEVSKVKDIFYAADILALNNETYSDSSVVRHVGDIGSRCFDYHYTYSKSIKLHRIIIRDTITNKEVCVSRYDKFVDNITIYREMLYVNKNDSTK